MDNSQRHCTQRKCMAMTEFSLDEDDAWGVICLPGPSSQGHGFPVGWYSAFAGQSRHAFQKKSAKAGWAKNRDFFCNPGSDALGSNQQLNQARPRWRE